MLEQQPRMYTDFAAWWPLLSPPAHYVEEAADLLPVLFAATASPPATLLELGSGGGSLAFHLKRDLRLTLTDRSPQMLAVNRAINPECEHVLGDMRSLRLEREFDLVLVHDAIMYAVDAASVRATTESAWRHCRPGGAVVLVPDFVKETFEPKTASGGEDGADGRGLRYLEWIWDPDPADETCNAEFCFLFRDANGEVHCECERHRHGLFARETWLRWMREAGFSATSRIDPWSRDVLIGTKR
jgi:SAM-dependent methyltransferase